MRNGNYCVMNSSRRRLDNEFESSGLVFVMENTICLCRVFATCSFFPFLTCVSCFLFHVSFVGACFVFYLLIYFLLLLHLFGKKMYILIVSLNLNFKTGASCRLFSFFLGFIVYCLAISQYEWINGCIGNFIYYA